jgi:hypothetical protein
LKSGIKGETEELIQQSRVAGAIGVSPPHAPALPKEDKKELSFKFLGEQAVLVYGETIYLTVTQADVVHTLHDASPDRLSKAQLEKNCKIAKTPVNVLSGLLKKHSVLNRVISMAGGPYEKYGFKKTVKLKIDTSS